jgi:hypothetical protein
MKKIARWLGTMVLLVFVTPPSMVDERAKIQGTWQLVSFEEEFQASGERQHHLLR